MGLGSRKAFCYQRATQSLYGSVRRDNTELSWGLLPKGKHRAVMRFLADLLKTLGCFLVSMLLL